MSWFKRLKRIQTSTVNNKLEAPEGVWHKCEVCKHTSTKAELQENFINASNAIIIPVSAALNISK